MNLLFTSVGRRAELIKNFKQTLQSDDRIIATDMSLLAPAIYLADRYYIVPGIESPEYISTIMDICQKEHICAVTTFIDPEIAVLAAHREQFAEIGVEVLAPYTETAALCFDKYKMYNYLRQHGIPTVLTYGSYDEFTIGLQNKEIDFPVFVKPRTGSGSVGAQKVADLESLKSVCERDSSLIIQEYMNGVDLDADVYVDSISHQAVSAFSKRKLETKIGGASKTVSFKDERLFAFIREIVSKFRFNGPIDMDFFYRDGTYYLSEINPRFGGAYLHAYGAGVDFIKLIVNNLNRIENQPQFGNYESNVAMLMYDSVVITKIDM